uniref:Uncharacterized protein n=1 Tax=Cyanistes caeruleus TaxID=156563 RepID=A0A8C0TVK4_CYACU
CLQRAFPVPVKLMELFPLTFVACVSGNMTLVIYFLGADPGMPEPTIWSLLWG